MAQVAARSKEGVWPSPLPGQTLFPLKPQADLSWLAAVSLPHLCSHTAQGQAYKVRPVSILLGLQISYSGPGTAPVFGV